MTEPSLALQIAIRERLISTPEITADVPADRVVDSGTRPENFPTIVIGGGQTILEGFSGSVRSVRVFCDLHVWTLEAGLEVAKGIAGNVADALVEPPAIDGFHLAYFRVISTRYMRDPSEKHGHAVVTVEAIMEQVL